MQRRARGLKDVLKEDKISLGGIIKKDESISDKEMIELVDLSLISPNPYQPRRVFDQEKLDELTNSIKEHGVFQPIVLKKENNGYLIVAGERRYRAAIRAGLKVIPAITRNYDESQVIELSLIENLQREDLSPIEEAEAYNQLKRTMGLTHQEIAMKVSKSRSHITNLLGLLNLPEDVQELVNEKKITMAHARVLSKIEDPKRIKELAKMIIAQGLSVRQIEQLAKEEVKTVRQARREKPNIYVNYEKDLKSHLGYPVNVQAKRLTISYKNDEELRKLLDKLLK